MLNSSSLYDIRWFRNVIKQSMKTISKFQHVHYRYAISRLLNMNQALNYTHLLSGVISPRIKSTLFCYEGLLTLHNKRNRDTGANFISKACLTEKAHMNDMYLMTLCQRQCRVKMFISWERCGNWCPF